MKAKGQLSNPLPLPYHVISSSESSGFLTLSSSWLGELAHGIRTHALVPRWGLMALEY